MFPDTTTKGRGDYVRTVHPYNVGRYPDGVVMSVEGEGEQAFVYVRIGQGSTVYGPSRNWEVIATAPAWYSR